MSDPSADAIQPVTPGAAVVFFGSLAWIGDGYNSMFGANVSWVDRPRILRKTTIGAGDRSRSVLGVA